MALIGVSAGSAPHLGLGSPLCVTTGAAVCPKHGWGLPCPWCPHVTAHPSPANITVLSSVRWLFHPWLCPSCHHSSVPLALWGAHPWCLGEPLLFPVVHRSSPVSCAQGQGPLLQGRGWLGGGPLAEPSMCQLISCQVLLMDQLLFLVSRAINLCHLAAASCTEGMGEHQGDTAPQAILLLQPL